VIPPPIGSEAFGFVASVASFSQDSPSTGSGTICLMLMGPGSFVRSVRRRHGLTQAELARRVGTSRASIARLEADGVSPTIATLEKILLAVGEELELSCVRRPLPRDDDAELMTEMSRPMAERLHSALVANDRSKLMSGILADDQP
jgi:transcriptional regulator with XRE-family HTH domain